MTKLYTFGCSYTFGQGLDDLPMSFRDRNKSLIPPSKLGWPNLVATALGYELVNLAVPGISNRHIVHVVLNELPYIDPKGKVIIHWTHVGRSMFFTTSPNPPVAPSIYKNVRNSSLAHIERIAPWIKTKTSENYYKHIGNEFHWYHDAIMLMDYTDLKLKQHGISKVLHLGPALGAGATSGSTSMLLRGLKEDLYSSKMRRDETVIHLMQIDKAKDDSHPGLKTQHKYAQYIIKEHGEYLNG